MSLANLPPPQGLGQRETCAGETWAAEEFELSKQAGDSQKTVDHMLTIVLLCLCSCIVKFFCLTQSPADVAHDFTRKDQGWSLAKAVQLVRNSASSRAGFNM